MNLRTRFENAQASKGKKGFTIIEVIVSLSIFIIVMTVAASSLLSIINSSKKSHELKSVMDNLNFALDDMIRNVRVGNTYICGPSITISSGITVGASLSPTAPNCASPSESVTYNQAFEFTTTDGFPTVYYLNSNHIFTSVFSSGSWSSPQQLTASQVNVTDMRFYVVGATVGASDGQPYVVITVDGTAGQGVYKSSFYIQTSVTQRQYDS